MPDADDEEVELVYGIPCPKLPEGLQPLECVVLLTGIDMESGAPTMTALGSSGLSPWVAVGLLEIEAARLKMGYTLTAIAFEDEDDDDE